MRSFPRFSVVFLAALLAVVTAAQAGQHSIKPFEGRFIGRSLTNMSDQVSTRDFDVTIEAGEKEGFEVSWTTFIHRGDGSVKKKASKIAFRKTDRPGVFASAQKTDMFGNLVPYDPMDGDPYVWARIDGEVLSVFGLLVTESGGYEIQTYHRTLTDGGMDLEFTRTGENGLIRSISGTLQRVGD